jgi:hypothetical protein
MSILPDTNTDSHSKWRVPVWILFPSVSQQMGRDEPALFMMVDRPVAPGSQHEETDARVAQRRWAQIAEHAGSAQTSP